LNPHQSTFIVKIESIQNRLLRVLAYKANKIGTSLEQLATDFNTELLEMRRKYIDLLWLNKLLNSQIDCPELLCQILLMVPSVDIRLSHTLYTESFRKNYYHFAPLNRMLTSSNRLKQFNFFNDSSTSLKSMVNNLNLNL
jgi:patatin-like phospholipase/acyl hydrolase